MSVKCFAQPQPGCKSFVDATDGLSNGKNSFCSGKTLLLFYGDSSGNKKLYQWFTGVHPRLTPIPGAIYPRLLINRTDTFYIRVIDTSNPTKWDTGFCFRSVFMESSPKATFTANPNTGCGKTIVNFTSVPNPGGTQFDWNFGDINNNQSSIANPSHIYLPSTNTTYNIQLIVKNQNGNCSDTFKNSVTINVGADASFNVSGNNITPILNSSNIKVGYKICSPLPFANFIFDDNSTTTSSNTNYKISWGDGSPDTTFTSINTAIPHRYNIGLYTLTYTVTNNQCTNVQRATIFLGTNPAVGIGSPGNTDVCTPATLTFPIDTSVANKNPLGTTYTLSFNDGSADTTFNHPPPPFVSHVFNVGSCGTSSPIGGQNAFYAKLTASNPCRSTDAYVTGITVTEKPKTIIGGPKNVCLNKPVTIMNTGNIQIVPFGVSNCTSGSVVWKINPSTGWTLNSGLLGDDLGKSQAADWISGTVSLGITFTKVGKYTFSLKTGGNTCSFDSVIKEICVDSTPNVNFSLDSQKVCVGATVKAATKVGTFGCSSLSYLWQINYANTVGCKPEFGDYEYVNGTDSLSRNPQIKFKTPGLYILSLNATVKDADCDVNNISQFVNVLGIPNVSIDPLQSVCQNTTIAPKLKDSCNSFNTTYKWTFANGIPNIFNGLSPTNIILKKDGLDTIKITATNECGSKDTLATIQVFSAPKITANPASTKICNGRPVTISLSSSITGTRYIWESTANSSVSGNTSNNVPQQLSSITNTLTTSSTNNDTVVYKIISISPPPTNCYGDTVFVTVIIQGGVTAANAGSDTILCNQSIFKLRGNAATGGTGVWKQISGLPVTIIDSTLFNSDINNLIEGEYKFAWEIKSNIPGCSSSIDTVTINNRPQVTKANAGADILKCNLRFNNTTQIVSANINTGRPYELGTWSFVGNANGAIINNINNPNTTLNFSNPGVYTVLWTIVNDAQTLDSNCKRSVDTIIVTVKEFPIAGSINGSGFVCLGTNVGNLTVIGNTIAANLQWQSSIDNITYNTISGATSTTYNPGVLGVSTWYRLKTFQTDCLDTVYSNPFFVQVDSPSIGGIITPNNLEVCTNSGDINLAIQNKRGNNYDWIIDIDNAGFNSFSPTKNTQNITVENNPFIQNTTNNIIVLSVKSLVKNGVCPADSSAIAIIKVYPNTATADAGIDQDLCNQTTTTLAAAAPTTGTGTWSQVSGPNAATLNSVNSATSSVSNLVLGRYVFKWQLSGSTSNICPSTFDTVVIFNYDSIKNLIVSTKDTTCENQSININTSSTITGGNGTYTYQWQQSLDNSNWINIALNSTNENYTTNAASSLFFRRLVYSTTCNDTSNVVYVNVQPGLNNNTINASQIICINTTPALVNGLQPIGGNGIYTYQWQFFLANNWVDIATQNNINYQPPISNKVGVDSFRRVVSSGYCIGALSNVVGIETKPDSKANYAFVNNLLCAPALIDSNNIKPQIFAAGNGTYEWYVNDTLIGTGTSFPNYTMFNTGDSITIKLKTLSAFGCKSDSFERKFYTVTKPVVSFTKSIARACGPLTVSFNNTSTPFNIGTYKWTLSNGQTFNTPNIPSISFDADNSVNRKDTIYTIKLTYYTQCDSITYIDSVIVLPKPRALFQPDTTIGCSVFKFRAFNNSLGTHNQYTWDWGDNSPLEKDTLLGYYSHSFQTNVTDTFYIKLIAENTCGKDSFIVNILVYPNTIVPKLILDGTTNFGCAPTTIKFINNTRGANKFTVDFGDTTPLYISNKNPDTIYHYYKSGGTYIATMKAENSCTDSTTRVPVTLYSKPNASFTTTKNDYCINEKIDFTNTSDTGKSYEWIFTNTNKSNQVNPSFSYSAAGIYDVVLIIKSTNVNGSICTDTARKRITIRPTPNANFSNNAVLNNCQPYQFVGQANNVTGNIYSWKYFDANSIDTTSAGSVGTHIFYRTGTYKITLNVLSNFGCKDSSQVFVKVIESPKANFTETDSIFCTPGRVVNFFNTSTYGLSDPLNYEWYINNVLQSTTTNFSYNFTANVNITTPVIYQVKLITTNAFGCKDSSNKRIIVQPKSQASFVTNATQGCVPFNLQFNNTSSFSNKYKWFIDDVLFSTNNTPASIVLSIPDKTYTIKLLSDNSLGCGADSTVLLFTTHPKPVADFRLANLNACTGKALVNFFDNSFVNNGNITKWLWKFGNGNSDTIQNPLEQYQVPGLFNISLVVKDNRGCSSDAANNSIKNFGKPVARFNVSDVCKGTNVIPVNLSTVGFGSTAITSYTWDFGDNFATTGSQPIHTYTNDGVFNIRLIVTSDSSCVPDTIVNPIKIFGKPKANFTVANNCINNTAIFTNTSFAGFGQPGIGISRWNYANGSFGNTLNGSSTYNATGDYNVSLIVAGNKCPTLLDTTVIKVSIFQARQGNQYPIINASRTAPIFLNAASGGVNYSWIPPIGLNNSLTQNPIANYSILDPAKILYTITIEDSFGCKAKDTQQVWLFNGSDVFLPTAFTPNNDRANDEFKPIYIGIQKVDFFRVFDRWGKPVFETSDMGKSWDGTLNGNKLPMDTYTWVIKCVDVNGNEIIRKGNVTIIRD